MTPEDAELLRRAIEPGVCWFCDEAAAGARVYMRALDRAVWLPACLRHRTRLILAT